MKCVKMLVLAAIAATALMAFAGNASATQLTAPAGTVVKTGTELSFSLKSKTSTILTDTSGIILDTCTSSTISGKTSNESGTTITIPLYDWVYNFCLRKWIKIKLGTLHISISRAVSGSGTELETETPTGTCVYGTSTGTSLGTLTDAASATSHAALVINAVLPLIKTVSGTCVSDARWKAEYTITSPTGLVID